MIFKTKTEKPKETELEVELWLEERGDGSVSLMGKNKEFDSMYLMRFSDGKFYRNKSVGLDGLETDNKGRILETDKSDY